MTGTRSIRFNPVPVWPCTLSRCDSQGDYPRVLEVPFSSSRKMMLHGHHWPDDVGWKIAIPFHSTPSRAHCSWAKPVSWMSVSACTCFVEYSTSSYSSSAIFPATCACFLEFKIILRQFHTVRKPWDLFWGYFGYLRDSFANTPARTSTLKTADR